MVQATLMMRRLPLTFVELAILRGAARSYRPHVIARKNRLVWIPVGRPERGTFHPRNFGPTARHAVPVQLGVGDLDVGRQSVRAVVHGDRHHVVQACALFV